MSDLDDDLLALAGVSDSEEEQITTSRKRKYDDDFDGDEGDENDEEDEEEEEEEEAADELINPYPLENKYKDDDDRNRLLNMDEMSREEILFERSQEMERFNERKFLQDRLKQQKSAASSKTRTSKRSKPVGASRNDKLSELRKQRERKQRKDDYSEEEEDEEDEEEEEELDDEPLSDYEEGQVVWGTKSKKTKSYAKVGFQDINKLLIGRTFLHKYYFYPSFEDIIVDCYGRINLGSNSRTKQPMYRMVKIIDVKHIPDKKYKLPSFESDLYLMVSQNKKQTKLFPINVFSDNAITEDEFDRYLKELDKNNEEVDYLDDVNEKFEDLTKLINKGLTDQDINEIMGKKHSTIKTLNGYDAVFQKATLMDKLKIAKQQGNRDQIEKVSNQLKELDSMLVDSKSKHNTSKQLDTMSKVNERNRKLNMENIRKAEIKNTYMRKTASKDLGDPFQRLKTVTRVFYEDIINLENEKAKKDAEINLKKMIDEKAAIETKIAKSSYRALGVIDQLINDIDVDFKFELGF